MSTDSLQLEILRLFFPEGILDLFDIVGFDDEDKNLTIRHEEKALKLC